MTLSLVDDSPGRGKPYKEWHLHCPGCSLMTSAATRNKLLARLRRKAGEYTWHLSPKDGRWYCNDCTGWRCVYLKEGSEEWNAVKRIQEERARKAKEEEEDEG